MAVAYNPLAVVTSIGELLEGTIGAARALQPGVFERENFLGRSLEEKQELALRSHSARHLIQVELGVGTQNGAGPISSIGSRDIWDKPATIYVLTPMATVVELQDRDTVRYQLEQDLWNAVQALITPGNLRLTSASVETGISSGLLSGPNGAGTRPVWGLTSESWELQLLESQINGLVTLDVAMNT